MNKSKLDIVKQIYAKKNLENTKTNKAQEAYSKRLQNDIEKTKRFIQQADDGINRLQVGVADQEKDERKRLIAQFVVYEKLAYSPQRDDVIDSASASVVTKRLVQEQTEAVEDFKNDNRQKEEQLKRMKVIINEFRQLSREMDAKKRSLETIIDDMSSKEPVETIQQKLDQLKSKQEQTSKMEQLLSMYLERVILKFLALSDWQNSSVSDENMVRDKLEACLNLVYSLIEVSDWVRIEILTESQESFVNWLSMNNIIKERRDDTGLYLKLLNFSQIE